METPHCCDRHAVTVYTLHLRQTHFRTNTWRETCFIPHIFIFSSWLFFSWHERLQDSTQLHGISNCLCCVAPCSCHMENTRVFLRRGTKNIQALRACARPLFAKITAAVNGRLGRTECGPRSGSNPKRVSKAPPHSHRPSPTTASVMSP